MAPRYEFRIFGEGLGAEREVLRRLAGAGHGAGEEEARTDVYFVVPGHADASLKLRGDKLDLKLLRAGRDGLELWEPAAEARFPLAPERLRDALLKPAGAWLDLPAAPVGRDLLLALGHAASGLRIVRVEKRRRQYRVQGVRAEFTRLSADGRPAESIAIEEADPDRALGAVAALGLLDRRNTSYQRWLVETFLPATGGRAGDQVRPGDRA